MKKDITVEVQVTQKDISDGVRFKGKLCPITLALARALPNHRVYSSYGDFDSTGAFYRMDYSDTELYDTEDELGKKISLPEDVLSFMLCFDNGSFVFPFSFTLTLPAGITP